jgi:hypothetical protein
MRWRRRRRASAQDGEPTVLVDHWYSHAVGHVIEALRRCQGYHACDPTLRLGLVLNAASPVELVRCAPFVHDVFPVGYTSFGTPDGDPRAALARIPREWDYVLRHPATLDPDQVRFEGLRRYNQAASRHFRARIATGIAGQPPPAYAPNQELRLVLPDESRAAARRELDGTPTVAVMPAGSGASYLYPSTASWLLVLAELERRLPNATFAFVGRLRSEAGRTTSGTTRDSLDRLLAAPRRAVDLFDRPILDQLAGIEASSLFVSPHTGFGFAAVAVGTPWLTLSGGDWFEYFFNGVPFYSVLPKSREYPAFSFGRRLPMIEADEDGEGPRTASMGIARVRHDLEELGNAAALLVGNRLSYDEALAEYLPRLADTLGNDRSRLWTFDDVHVGCV